MKKIKGIYLPSDEKHLTEWIEADGHYQKITRDEAFSMVTRKRNAIDIGAHCGLWAMDMVREFDHVHAFEPIEEHRECFEANVSAVAKWTMYPYALGEYEADVFMEVDPTNTGHTHVNKSGVLSHMKRLDDFHLTDIDFIKIDCEGYEYYVCLGGRDTIMRERPVICIEQKPHGFYGLNTHAGVKLLAEWGMKEIGRVRQDFIMGWT